MLDKVSAPRGTFSPISSVLEKGQWYMQKVIVAAWAAAIGVAMLLSAQVQDLSAKATNVEAAPMVATWDLPVNIPFECFLGPQFWDRCPGLTSRSSIA